MWHLRSSLPSSSIHQSQAYLYVILGSDFSVQMGQFLSEYCNHWWQSISQSDHRYFQKITIIFSSQPFYGKYVWGSTANDPVSPRIYGNRKLWPFFQGCLGAIDGSHMPISPPAVTFGSEWVRTSENESGASRDSASAYVLCLRTLVVPNLQRDEGGSLGK